jgi:O-acetyl-ADP-ribose deacetylase (regulator of RNase III)
MNEIKGDLLQLAREGRFDLIAHGCNCFCTMGSGIAKQIHEEFPEAYKRDCETAKGDINKLGNYSLEWILPSTTRVPRLAKEFRLLNLYTQYRYGKDQIQIDYEALTLGLRKINHNFSGKTIGLPMIGAGLAGGDWNKIKKIIETELINMDVTIVYYEPVDEDRFDNSHYGKALFPNT